MKVKEVYIVLALSLIASVLFSSWPEPTMAGPPEPDGQSGLGLAVSEEAGGILPFYTGCGGVTAPVVNADYEQEVVELVNAERAARGIPPLKRVSKLDKAARYHATDMGQDDYFDHDSYDRSGGSLVKSCGWVNRVQSYYSNWGWLGENIAAGQSTPQSVMNAWMNSSGHRANILSTNFYEIGVGYHESGETPYWVQDFGRRWDVYPVIINQEAATTDSVNVSLYIYGQGTWSEMRLRDGDGSWSEWMPFQSNLAWTLNPGGGEHTVWVELRNGTETTTSSDTIWLDLPQLGNLPDALQFTFSIPDQRLLPPSSQVTPRNTGNDEILTWQLAQTGSWFSALPTNGSTPVPFTITPTNFAKDAENVYTGSVVVTVTSPAGVGGSPHQIDLTLNVVNASFNYIYLPMLAKK